MKSRNLPACRTDAMVLNRTLTEDHDDCVVCDTPSCRDTWYGHRIVLDDPPEDVDRWFDRWDVEHQGKGIGTAYLVWEHRENRSLRVPDGAVLSIDRAMMHDDWQDSTPATDDLRPLTRADLPEMLRLMAAEYGDDDGSRAHHSWHADQIYAHIQDGRGALWGRFEDKRLIGTASIVWGREAQIQNVLVASAHRRRGHATTLVTAVIGAYRDVSMATIYLVTELDSHAEGLYRGLGFRHVTYFYELSMPRRP